LAPDFGGGISQMKRTVVFRSFAVASALSVFTSCGNRNEQETDQSEISKPISTDNRVMSDSACVNRLVGNENISYQVVNACGLKEQANAAALVEMQASAPLLKDGEIKKEETPVKTKENSLIVGFPTKKLGKEFIFGTVFTKVGAKKDEILGRMKLLDLTGLHVRPILGKDLNNNLFLVLRGCVKACTETSDIHTLFNLPIAGASEDLSTIFLDISALGKGLNIFALLDPTGEVLKVKVHGVKATSVDFTTDTLVFDIEHAATKKLSLVDIIRSALEEEGEPAKPEEFSVTARWYMKETSGLNTAFTTRSAVEGVGFFGTDRAKNELINRFSIAQTPNGSAPIHYYIKNVPSELHKVYAESFEEWNKIFKNTTGSKKISYEFVDKKDPKAALLVSGDPRFNIIEWDLDNIAPYAALGPSLASQTTGEIFAAQILVQGPRIVESYSEWFKVNQKAKDMKAKGQTLAAEKLLAETAARLAREAQPTEAKISANIGDLALNVPSQDIRLMDRLAARTDFFPIPDGVTYESYMHGYWLDVGTHELGHNLGLRHNFRGNLFYNEEEKRVSGSVMEYLNKSFRHLDSAGPYDTMAIAYGYTGKKPERTDMFCTDEQVINTTNDKADYSTFNPECSRDDATDDPFGYLEKELTRAVDLLVNRGSTDVPAWTWSDMESNVKPFFGAILTYVTGAEKTSAKWTNWQPKVGKPRPTEAAAIKAYAIDHIKALQCRAGVVGAEAQKASTAGKELVRKNLESLKEFMRNQAKAYKLDSAIFDCGK